MYSIGSRLLSGLICAPVLLTGALLASPTALAEETASSISRGGQLYDKWWAVNGAEKPATAHPAYPADAKYSGQGGADWRCKECHGWDYMGNAGAYSSGSHATGIPGITGAAGKDEAAIIEILQNDTHGFTDDMLDAEDLQDLALFVSQGQVDMDQHIDRAEKTIIGGNAAGGEPIYQTVCAKCHGDNGAMMEDGEPISGDREALGAVANANPWETLHKIRMGQPDENMPAMLAFDPQITLDLLAYLQTLPDAE